MPPSSENSVKGDLVKAIAPIEGGSASAGSLRQAELTMRSTSTGASSEMAAVVYSIATLETFGRAATAPSAAW
jgi:hypothetical protein